MYISFLKLISFLILLFNIRNENMYNTIFIINISEFFSKINNRFWEQLF